MADESDESATDISYLDRILKSERFQSALTGLEIGLIIGAVIIIFVLLYAAFQVLSGGFAEAATAIATISVALVTTLYAALTWRLVKSTEHSIRLRQTNIEEERRRELESLRIGLVHEINRLPVERIEEFGYKGTKHVYDLAPRTVFEQNAGDIGLLEPEEVEAVSRYYHELSKYVGYLQDYSQRTAGGNIQRRAESLCEARDAALESLESNLEHDIPTESEASEPEVEAEEI